MWKGDTADVPSGNSNPEGSDTSPGLERTRETDESRLTGVSTSQAGARVPRILSNNQYAVLHDENDDFGQM